MDQDTAILLAELKAIEHWDRSLIYQDRISALNHLSYELRKERKAEIEVELKKRGQL